MSSPGDREPPLKRYRRREEERKSDDDDFEKEGDDYVPYVPVRSSVGIYLCYIMHMKNELRWRGTTRGSFRRK